LRSVRTGITFEVHHRATACASLFPLDLESLWRRGGEGFLRAPEPADHLVLLALHAVVQHGLALRLGQLYDFRALLEHAVPNAGIVVARAQAARATGALALALDLAGATVAAPVPLDLRAALSDPRAAVGRFWSAHAADPCALLAPRLTTTLVLRWHLAAATGQRVALLAELLQPRGLGPSGGLSRVARLLRTLFAEQSPLGRLRPR
jgi:hypothetical protein